MAQIRFFSTLYPEANQERLREYLYCLDANLRNERLSGLFVLNEGNSPPREHPKLTLRTINRRPTYNDFFNWINELSSQEDFSIIANTDIALDESIRIIEHFQWKELQCLALSRWDIDAGSYAKLFERGDSQDVWIFKGKIPLVNGNFPLGVYDCDNKIAWELEQAGYRVINPCYAVRTYHHHQCGFRSYEVTPPPDYGIRPPFRYVEPDNYWGPLKALRIQRQLNLGYFPWMLTKNRFWRYPIPKLALRIWNKAIRVVSPKSSRCL